VYASYKNCPLAYYRVNISTVTYTYHLLWPVVSTCERDKCWSTLQMVRCDGKSLLPYKSQLQAVLKLTLHVVCKEVLTLSCVLLKHLLKALTLIYANDYRSSTNDWDLPLSQVLPIRVRTAVDVFSWCFGSRPSDHYFRRVCLFVCLFVCLCRVFLSHLWSAFDQTRTHVICLGLVVSPRI